MMELGGARERKEIQQHLEASAWLAVVPPDLPSPNALAHNRAELHRNGLRLGRPINSLISLGPVRLRWPLALERGQTIKTAYSKYIRKKFATT
jgi:hypothetical protein